MTIYNVYIREKFSSPIILPLVKFTLYFVLYLPLSLQKKKQENFKLSNEIFISRSTEYVIALGGLTISILKCHLTIYGPYIYSNILFNQTIKYETSLINFFRYVSQYVI